MGAKNWNYKSIKKYFDKAEKRLYIEHDQYIHPSMRDLLNEAQILYGATPSFNEKSNGWAKYHTTKRMGRRFSSSDAYLKPTLRKFIEKFHLKLNSKVNKLLFNDLKDQVIGIEYRSNDSKKIKTVKAKYEVIISAGAFGTPEILLRNGIGNKTELSNLNINLVKDIPGVGKNLIDHATTAFTYKTKETKWQSIEYIANNTISLVDYLLFGTGSLTSNLAEIGGYIKTKYSKYNDVEDIQFHCGPLLFAVDEFSERRLRENDTSNYISCLISTVIPRDIGYINLKSNKEDDKSIIVTNFLKNEEDYKSIIEGFSYAKKIFETETFKNKVEMYIPNKEELKNEINFKNYVFRSLFEVYHPVGTSKMGNLEKDEMAVVDSELKVRGFKNLRVVDASIMPEITNSNTNSPTIMIAEKAADMILNKNNL